MKRTRKIVTGILIVLVSSVSFRAAAQEVPLREEDPTQKAAEQTIPQPTQGLLLKEGTEVNLKLAQKLSAKSAFVGEPVELVLAKDLKVGDAVVVKQGARVLGTVVAGKESEKKRNEAHQLTMRVDFLRAGNAKIKLRGEKVSEGKRNKDAMIAGTIFLGLSGLLATSGKHYMIPEGSPVTAYVDEDIELQTIAP
jgi:uncharacterized Zn ribbon protein